MSRDKLGETEEAWFNDEFGGAPSRPPARVATARAIDQQTRTQLLVLGALVVLTFVVGLALGAFSSHATPEPVAPAPQKAEATTEQRAALETADQWAGTRLLSEDALLVALGGLLEERRADVAPLPTDVPEPGEAPEDVAKNGGAPSAASTPTARKVPRPDKAPVEKAPVEKAPVEKAPTDPAPPEKAPAETPPTEQAPEPVAVTASAKEKAAAAIAEGKAKTKSGDWKGAVAAYTDALAASPGDLTALAGRGRASFELKQTDLAKQDLEAVLKQNPTHATALLTLGSIAQDQGQKAAARDYYERYLRRYPNGRRAAEVREVLDKL
ncbi:MAG: tetratricopeptide repeat protein [Deltaproteobacteria bacterium]|nr:MAG: tetratricopeptide repeat protein [Deltaproteobacteria bacterium]